MVVAHVASTSNLSNLSNLGNLSYNSNWCFVLRCRAGTPYNVLLLRVPSH